MPRMAEFFKPAHHRLLAQQQRETDRCFQSYITRHKKLVLHSAIHDNGSMNPRTVAQTRMDVTEEPL